MQKIVPQGAADASAGQLDKLFVGSRQRGPGADRIGGDVHVRHVIDDHSDPEAVAVVRESFSRPEEADRTVTGKRGSWTAWARGMSCANRMLYRNIQEMDGASAGKTVLDGGSRQHVSTRQRQRPSVLAEKEHHRMQKKTWSWVGAAIVAVMLQLAQAAAHEPRAESPAGMTHDHSHDHGHSHDHDHGHDHDHASTESSSDGYFQDEQVQPRPLSDWTGEWRSVYPYLLDGTLDPVLAHKAQKGDKTVAEYQAYYEAGYRTETNRIVIDGDRVAFIVGEESVAGEYASDGFEILTYEKGNRGVRYVFKKVGGDKTAPGFIQFSDHLIAPEKSGHYHLY